MSSLKSWSELFGVCSFLKQIRVTKLQNCCCCCSVKAWQCFSLSACTESDQETIESADSCLLLTFWQRSSVAYVFISLISVMSSIWGFYIKWVWGLGNVLGAYSILSMHEPGYCCVSRLVWKEKGEKGSKSPNDYKWIWRGGTEQAYLILL